MQWNSDARKMLREVTFHKYFPLFINKICFGKKYFAFIRMLVQ